ncbi:MAG: SDR family NAD(P)-dependent oxidoreductase [Planctomycetota bacterium]
MAGAADEAGGLRVYDGAVAIVTGGASGIGEALAVELAARRASVIVADRDGEGAAAVAGTIQARGGDATAARVDVSDHAAVKELVRQTVTRHGRLDFMFNLVGIIYTGTALDHSIDDWNRILDVNVRGVANGVEVAYPIMTAQGFGHIVNMSSTAGLVHFYNVPYTASRFAVVGLSLTLRGEASMHGVRVTLLCPGPVRTATFSAAGVYGRRLRDLPDEVVSGAVQRLRPRDPYWFARLALRGIAKNRAMIVAPWRARMLWRSYRRTPLLTTRVVFRRFLRPLLLQVEAQGLAGRRQGQAATADTASKAGVMERASGGPAS